MNFFQNDKNVQQWKNNSPLTLPQTLDNYQNFNADFDPKELEDIIDKEGKIIPKGQYLFHGGYLKLCENDERYLDRYFPTTISPGEALFQATLGGRAYDNGKIEKLIITVLESKINAMILFQNSATLNHEYEVLFGAGLKLKVLGVVQTPYTIEVDDCNDNKKEVPIEIIFCYIS